MFFRVLLVLVLVPAPAATTAIILGKNASCKRPACTAFTSAKSTVAEWVSGCFDAQH
jgi:hypothetical protein